jgi:hypothetical protein
MNGSDRVDAEKPDELTRVEQSVRAKTEASVHETMTTLGTEN